jgi:DNA-binding transcriptional LysR family regulator
MHLQCEDFHMPDWESLRHFAALARTGTLAGAARALNVEHATVARRIVSLESELNLKLLDRRGRKIELTPHGREFLAALERMQSEADAIERFAAGKRTELSGEVTISAPPGLAAAMLAPPVARLQGKYPALTLQIITETRQSALQRREADLAIRLADSTDQDLSATKLGEINFRLYAHPDYLAATPEAEWEFIGYDTSMDEAPQQIAMTRIAQGRRIAIRTNSLALQMNLVREGAGLAMLPDFLTKGEPLSPAAPHFVHRDVWLVIHSDMTGSSPVQAVAAMLIDDLHARLEQPGPPELG